MDRRLAESRSVQDTEPSDPRQQQSGYWSIWKHARRQLCWAGDTGGFTLSHQGGEILREHPPANRRRSLKPIQSRKLRSTECKFQHIEFWNDYRSPECGGRGTTPGTAHCADQFLMKCIRINNEHENPDAIYASPFAVGRIRRCALCANQQGSRDPHHGSAYDRQMRCLPHCEWQQHDATALVSPHYAGSLGGSDQTNGPPQRADHYTGGSKPG